MYQKCKAQRVAPNDCFVLFLSIGVFGFPTALGDADFFPNGGVALQPGCRLSQLSHRGHPDEVGKDFNYYKVMHFRGLS